MEIAAQTEPQTEPTKTGPYAQIYKAVSHLVKHYRNDLEIHDKAAIEPDPQIPFLHFAGEMGTHLVTLPPAWTYPARGQTVPFLFGRADREHLLNNGIRTNIHAISRHWGHYVVHYWDGARLRMISHLKAADIGETYIARIRNEWRKDK